VIPSVFDSDKRPFVADFENVKIMGDSGRDSIRD
jgi:hypothetical protein